MKNSVKGLGGKHMAHAGRIADVHCVKLGPFRHGVAVPGRQVIDDRHLVTLPKQFLSAHGAHIPGSARNENSTHCYPV